MKVLDEALIQFKMKPLINLLHKPSHNSMQTNTFFKKNLFLFLFLFFIARSFVPW